MRTTLFIFCLCLRVAVSAQEFFTLKIPKDIGSPRVRPAVDVKGPWKYHDGDNLQWADTSFDDTKWTTINPRLPLDSLAQGAFTGVAWFRLHLKVDTSLLDKTLAFLISQEGASEIYLDGKLIHAFGELSVKGQKEERYDPLYMPFDIRFKKTPDHTLAIRYSHIKAIEKHEKGNMGFNLKIGAFDRNVIWHYISSGITISIFVFYFTFFLALGFLHLTLYLYYRSNKSNLYYCIFALTFGTTFLCIVIQQTYIDPDTVNSFGFLMMLLSNFYQPALLAMLYNIFLKRIPRLFWIWLVLFSIELISNLFEINIPFYGGLLSLAFVIESLRMIIVSMVKKRDGAWIIGSGIIATITFFVLYIVLASTGHADFFSTEHGIFGIFIMVFVMYATVSIPSSMTVYLAREFARTSKNLEKKLVEVELLSEKSLQQEKEKQQILASQNETLERQVRERTLEINHQKEIIEEKNKDITDSINYAKRIQDAILSSKEIKYKNFPDAFVLFKPKDIVSGDFYWFSEKNGKKLIAACDCTGHGVPGALMSMIGNNVLNQLVNERGFTDPDRILKELHEEVVKTLKQEQKEATKDGMDVALLNFHNDTTFDYAGAQRPLWIVRDGALEETKATKISIGGKSENAVEFVKHSFTLQKGNTLYIFSDGYADQFNNQDKKLMTRKFKDLLLSIQHLSMPEQEKFLDDFIEEWKSGMEQTDDILVIGIRI